MRFALLWPLVGLVACDDSGLTTPTHGTAANTTDTEPPFAPCQLTIDQTVPDSGATDAYHRAPIEFHLTGRDTSAKVVTNIQGKTEHLDDSQLIRFVPRIGDSNASSLCEFPPARTSGPVAGRLAVPEGGPRPSA